MTRDLSPFTCHLSPVTYHLSPITCPLSPVTCHLSHVTCHLSPVTCHLSFNTMWEECGWSLLHVLTQSNIRQLAMGSIVIRSQRSRITYLSKAIEVATTLLVIVPRSMALLTGSASPNSLSGKRAIVTGSSGGIGADISLSLSAAVDRVLVHYRTQLEGSNATFAAILKPGIGSCDGIIG